MLVFQLKLSALGHQGPTWDDINQLGTPASRCYLVNESRAGESPAMSRAERPFHISDSCQLPDSEDRAVNGFQSTDAASRSLALIHYSS